MKVNYSNHEIWIEFDSEAEADIYSHIGQCYFACVNGVLYNDFTVIPRDMDDKYIVDTDAIWDCKGNLTCWDPVCGHGPVDPAYIADSVEIQDSEFVKLYCKLHDIKDYTI